MNIALFGYGKMGKAVEQIAIQRGHEIVLKIDSFQQDLDLKTVDVAIDFSTPSSACTNITMAISQCVPVVSGTTGWLDKLEKVKQLCKQKETAFLYASNFSVGVNLFFELNKYLAQLMQGMDYKVSIDETHHIHKLDAPSGTAISLAEQILPYTNFDKWQLVKGNDTILNLPIRACRKDEVSGVHTVKYDTSVDSISITHMAHNRQGFALGAVLASEFIYNKKGIFSMQDVLQLKNINF